MTFRPTLFALVTAIAIAAPAAPRAAAGPGDPRVPEVVDLPESVAKASLEAAGFAAAPLDQPGEPAGLVARQSPGGFVRAPAGTAVTIWVRRGAAGSPPPGPGTPPPIPPTPPPAPPTVVEARVPDVRGKFEAEATDLLKAWRVRVTSVVGTPANDGRVVNQVPAPGTSLAAGASIELTVARSEAPSGTTVVPPVLGLEQDAASRALDDAHLVPLVLATSSDPADAGKVVLQDPPAGTTVARKSNVTISVGRRAIGPLLEIEVPDCLKLSEADARAALEKAGLAVAVRYQLAPRFPGVVLNQDPVPGTRILRGRVVSLVVGADKLVPASVPDTVGMEAAAAEQTLRDAGFATEQVLAVSLPGSAGRVMAQEPPARTSAIRGSTVRITVGRPAPTLPVNVSVPSVAGRMEAEALDVLAQAGLSADVVAVPGAPAEIGRVRNQSPPAGSSVVRGSAVRLEVAKSEAGPVGVVLKNYVNMDIAAAQADLAAQGLQVATTRVDGTPEGRVIGQSPPPGATVQPGASVLLTVLHPPALPAVVLTHPVDRYDVPKQYGVVFNWNAVPEAEDYQFYIEVEKDGAWVTADNDIVQANYKKPHHVNRGRYRWHVRARRAGGTILGPWSGWRLLFIY